MRKLAIGVALVLVVCGSACGSSGDASVQSQLQGTWTACYVVSSAASYQNTTVISGNGYEYSQYSHRSGDCSGTGAYDVSETGTFTIGAAVSVPFGDGTVMAYPIDRTASNGEVFYDLVYVDAASSPRRMYDGLFTAILNTTTAAKRPIAIDSSFFYTLGN